MKNGMVVTSEVGPVHSVRTVRISLASVRTVRTCLPGERADASKSVVTARPFTLDCVKNRSPRVENELVCHLADHRTRPDAVTNAGRPHSVVGPVNKIVRG